MKGKKIAILGVGRSGLAVAKAAVSMGSEVVVLDERPRESLKNVEALAGVEELGLCVTFGWDGTATAGVGWGDFGGVARAGVGDVVAFA